MVFGQLQGYREKNKELMGYVAVDMAREFLYLGLVGLDYGGVGAFELGDELWDVVDFGVVEYAGGDLLLDVSLIIFHVGNRESE